MYLLTSEIDVDLLTNKAEGCSKIESFIRSKYESRRWAMDGPPPADPAELEQGGGASLAVGLCRSQ